ncbi:hypothetical protein HNR19_003688 [Nocardioides thalensis]|uniref:Uncharacterized protein n=1 Tax=Nocardioides thalensis TaxID=1914755 RepID=A0A853C4F4_9ACTN|nr:hypothetical protein [Nocardioides thalensis]NYJ02990.1 hypothetical protein [Nocardioides thalensis]
MTDRTITDGGVAGLPIHEGRAELLEEIMAIPTDHQHRTSATDELAERRRNRWLPVAGAAAAVAAIAAAVAVPQLVVDDEKTAEAPAAAAPGNGEIAVLQRDDWSLDNASIDERWGGELSYVADDQSIDSTPANDWGVTLDISWVPADEYAALVEDREHITKPPGPGEPVEVLGRPGQLWSYSADDHTVVREVVGDFALELRGTGLAEADFVALLDELVAIAPADLDAHLPDDFVTDTERSAVIEEMLADVPLPDGFVTSRLDVITEVDRYQLGARVTAAVTCAWIGQFADAKQAGDQAAMDEAAEAMATSRDWAILAEMQADGDWSSVIWDYADTLAAGKVPPGHQQGLGCMHGTEE